MNTIFSLVAQVYETGAAAVPRTNRKSVVNYLTSYDCCNYVLTLSYNNPKITRYFVNWASGTVNNISTLIHKIKYLKSLSNKLLA